MITLHQPTSEQNKDFNDADNGDWQSFKYDLSLRDNTEINQRWDILAFYVKGKKRNKRIMSIDVRGNKLTIYASGGHKMLPMKPLKDKVDMDWDYGNWHEFLLEGDKQ